MTLLTDTIDPFHHTTRLNQTDSVQGDGLAVLTGSEGASVWHWPSARRAMAIEDLRQACQGWVRRWNHRSAACWSLHRDGSQTIYDCIHVSIRSTPRTQAATSQFAVQYHYDGAQGRDRLLLSTSDIQGRITLLEVQPVGGLVPVAQVRRPRTEPSGTHRTALQPPKSMRFLVTKQLESGHQGLVRSVDFAGDTVVTGGEDARLCLWSLSGQGAAGVPPATPPTQQAQHTQLQAMGSLKHKTSKHHHHHHHHKQKQQRPQGGGAMSGPRHKPY